MRAHAHTHTLTHKYSPAHTFTHARDLTRTHILPALALRCAKARGGSLGWNTRTRTAERRLSRSRARTFGYLNALVGGLVVPVRRRRLRPSQSYIHTTEGFPNHGGSRLIANFTISFFLIILNLCSGFDNFLVLFFYTHPHTHAYAQIQKHIHTHAHMCTHACPYAYTSSLSYRGNECCNRYENIFRNINIQGVIKK